MLGFFIAKILVSSFWSTVTSVLRFRYTSVRQNRYASVLHLEYQERYKDNIKENIYVEFIKNRISKLSHS